MSQGLEDLNMENSLQNFIDLPLILSNASSVFILEYIPVVAKSSWPSIWRRLSKSMSFLIILCAYVCLHLCQLNSFIPVFFLISWSYLSFLGCE
ncbi:hypothetical protein FAD_0672 [Ferroplasma acidiphilum]|uniref:Uncharacterized protein n=1 Tax=Ferroplasma acidiphilum TaxID=74969 RepID=A0A1V0N3A7_9ARCH|nr:hypothetical protein FAD_0672 [Ferroplasma acidiphilum]